ncbi:MAG: hypothetical protein FWG37_00670 [Clostridia bacterium]|nr:hypothetical protein [Clostridia bacterium]
MIDVEMLRQAADEMLSGLSASDAAKEALRFKVSAVDNLASVTGEMLGGLTRTPALRHRILIAAERRTAPHKASRKSPYAGRFTPAMGMALALCLMFGIGAFYGAAPNSPLSTVESGMEPHTAGGPANAGVPQYQSLYTGEGANPPILGINGRYYRLLRSPLSVSSALAGTLITEVQDFTDEPSLASVVGVVSNIAKVGAPVYEVEGISHKTACLVEVEGVLRLFQRVSYASNAMIGYEMLEDTLGIQGQVKALELSGVGIVQDETDANELIYMLSEFAVNAGNDMPPGGQALTIYLKNGLSLQLMVHDEILGACGSWACPEFFEEFADRMNAG